MIIAIHKETWIANIMLFFMGRSKRVFRILNRFFDIPAIKPPDIHKLLKKSRL